MKRRLMKTSRSVILVILLACGAGTNAAPSYTNGIPILAGTALAFDGANAEVTVSAPITLSNANFSIEAWVRSYSSNANQFFLFQGTAQTDQGLHLGFRPNNVFTFGFWGDDLDTAATFTDFGWHHWACVYNLTNRIKTIFRDGVLVA